jgi:hypothetical protein
MVIGLVIMLHPMMRSSRLLVLETHRLLFTLHAHNVCSITRLTCLLSDFQYVVIIHHHCIIEALFVFIVRVIARRIES